MAKLKLSSPWVSYYHKVRTMFQNDPFVCVVYDEDDCAINLYVDNGPKAAALETLLPASKEFGTAVGSANVTLHINVIPSNRALSRMKSCKKQMQISEDGEEINFEDLFESAFYCNDVYHRTYTVFGPYGYNAIYVMFRKKVAQYYDDNLADYNGVRSTLYQDLAKEIFEEIPGVFYCTEVNQEHCLPF